MVAPVQLDENGWAVGAVTALPASGAWSLFSPEPGARVEAAAWSHRAATFFRARFEVVQAKSYPAGTLPIFDRVEVDVAPAAEGPFTRVLLITLPLDRAPDARRSALEGVQAIGGAGFDVLVARARRLWQVSASVDAGGDPRAPLLVAAVLASALLAPVVPPGGGTIFGVKGARVRLEAAGWRT
jgi:hypothetical protein